MPKVNVISAVSSNNAIGYANKLIYWLPADMRRFRELTTGNTIIMGRKTYESLPKGALPNRRNVVLTRSQATFPGCDVYASLADALASCGADDEVYIIGGASVYAEALDIADRLYMTEVDDIPAEADVFFPEYKSRFTAVKTERHEVDEKHAFPFSFVDYERSV